VYVLSSEEYQVEVVERLEKCLVSSTRGVQGAVIRALACYVDKLCILQREKASPDNVPSLTQICAVIIRTLEHSLGKPFF